MNMRTEPKKRLPIVTIHCDGSCLNNGNSGPGGWAALLEYEKDGQPFAMIVKGCTEQTTNNRMELSAAIGGLNALKVRCEVSVYSDSQYLVNSMQLNWKRKANQDLWQQLDKLVAKHKVKFVWIRGHNGNEKNELVNSVAQQEARKLQEGGEYGIQRESQADAERAEDKDELFKL